MAKATALDKVRRVRQRPKPKSQSAQIGPDGPKHPGNRQLYDKRGRPDAGARLYADYPNPKVATFCAALWLTFTLPLTRRPAEADKKKELSRFQDATLALARAFALASSSDLAREVKDEVGFLQAVRAAMTKPSVKGKLSSKAKQFAIEQLVNKAVADAEIVDILKAAGIKTPDISILSDEFLLEIQSMGQKNLALEALKKLLNGEIKSKAKANVVESRAFSERLEQAVARYHANAISTVEMIQTLIDLARDVKASAARGEAEGLSSEELAFYDALANNQSAVEAMGNAQLRLIAHELLEQIRSNVTVDWHKKESARARMRILVKRILKKYGYPPDLSSEAVQTVLEQAEVLLAEVAGSQ